jgi:hypothetical protein
VPASFWGTPKILDMKVSFHHPGRVDGSPRITCVHWYYNRVNEEFSFRRASFLVNFYSIVTVPGFALTAQGRDIPDSAFSEALAAEESDFDLDLGCGGRFTIHYTPKAIGRALADGLPLLRVEARAADVAALCENDVLARLGAQRYERPPSATCSRY